jgi:hypothetical protein
MSVCPALTSLKWSREFSCTGFLMTHQTGSRLFLSHHFLFLSFYVLKIHWPNSLCCRCCVSFGNHWSGASLALSNIWRPSSLFLRLQPGWHRHNLVYIFKHQWSKRFLWDSWEFHFYPSVHLLLCGWWRKEGSVIGKLSRLTWQAGQGAFGTDVPPVSTFCSI